LQIKEIIATLEMEEAKQFIASNLHLDLTILSLKYAGKTNFNIAVCLQLMAIYKKAEHKLPLYSANFLAITQRAYVQSTSEKVANFKRKFISGDTLVDLTAGLGIDAQALSVNFRSIIAVERNEELHDLAMYNLEKLGVKNIERICADANTFLSKKVSWIYLDPDRRPYNKRKVALEFLEPNVLDLLPKMRLYSDYAYIKLSPLFDVDEVWRVFSDASKIVILAEHNEIKEVGVILDFTKNRSEKCIELADVENGFQFTWQVGDSIMHIPLNEDSQKYLLIPNALLTKSRLSEAYLQKMDVEKHAEFSYYFSDSIYKDEGFRTFSILSSTGFNSSEISKMLTSHNISYLNITLKGLKESPDHWHKKLKTTDGGDHYLFLLKGKKKEALLCKLIS
jgi:16S rRNA G966 N2-methylase RsmD